MIALAVLDALGHADVAVPKELKPPLMPGVITPWHVIGVQQGEPLLSDASVGALKADDRWKVYALPETEPIETPWFE